MHYMIRDAEVVEIINRLGFAAERLADLAGSVKNPAPIEWTRKDVAAARQILSEVLARGGESDLAAEAIAEARANHDLATEAVNALANQR